MRHWVTRFSLVTRGFPSALLAAYRPVRATDRCSSTGPDPRDSNRSDLGLNLVKARHGFRGGTSRSFGVCFRTARLEIGKFQAGFSEASSERGYLSKITYSTAFFGSQLALSSVSWIREYRCQYRNSIASEINLQWEAA